MSENLYNLLLYIFVLVSIVLVLTEVFLEQFYEFLNEGAHKLVKGLRALYDVCKPLFLNN